VPEYPEFTWKELIVNAVAHRDYSIKGTDIQIKMFDDRITVESPGSLPGIVRLNNIRTVHFSRNPKIAEYLHEYEYVQEFGEGVDRMFNEMQKAGLPAPEYKDSSFMLNATIRNGSVNGGVNGSVNGSVNNGNNSYEEINIDGLTPIELAAYETISSNPHITRSALAKALKVSLRTVDRTLNSLKATGIIDRVGADKNGYWRVLR
jgi:ATP-dependent DNA helicase RecG